MNDGANFDKNGALKPDSPLAKLLQNAADYAGMSNLGKEEWKKEFGSQIAAAFTHINNRKAEEG
jgi:hypothetical protein